MAKKYIDREAVMDAFAQRVKRSNNSDFAPAPTWNNAVKIVEQFPAADVVEVVRCKDCEYSVEAWVNEKGFLICPASGMDITGDDYCSYGVKMGAEKDV